VSLLTIVQSAYLRALAIKPTVAASSADPKVLQCVECVNEAGQELASRHSWQGLTNEANFTTAGVAGGVTAFGTLTGGSGYAGGFSNTYNSVPLTGGTGTGAQATIAVTNGVVTSVTISPTNPGQGYSAGQVLSASAATLGGTGSGFTVPISTVGIVGLQAQGLITTLAGPDFNFIVNETMWNRSQRRPVFGPKSPAEWQQLEAQYMQGPWIQYRLRGNQLLFLPAPSPGFAIYFEWISKYWCQNATTVQGQTSMLLDTDAGILDERLLTLGTLWRFKQKNKLEYGEDVDIYEAAVEDSITRDGSKARLNLGGAQSDIYPGVVVPAGSWPLSGDHQ
jgi:hypothetical protein